MEGIVTYEQKINLHRKNTSSKAKAYIPEFKITKMELLIKGDKTVYRESTDVEPKTISGMQMTFKAGEGEIHKDLATGTSIQGKEFLSRKFIISDELESRNWR